MLNFIEIVNRAETGPPCSPQDWDRKHIALKAREILKEHGLTKLYDPKVIINQDDGLADSFFKAAFEFAINTGFYCIDTQRIIKFTEDEIKEALSEKVPHITLGRDFDKHVLCHRRPEDPNPPMAFFGPYGLAISEDIWIPVHQSITQQRTLDGLISGSLETVYGLEVKASTPLETLAGYYEGVLTKDAVKRAGRPGIPLCGAQTSPTQHGNMGGYGIPGGYETSDVPNTLAAAELKTGYPQLHKVAHVLNLGGPNYSSHISMIGGYPGPPEGAAMVATAALILQILVHQAKMVGGLTMDARYSCNTSPEALWGDSISGQAQSRNITRPIEGEISNLAGPYTDMILYEAAAAGITITASGATLLWGVRSAAGTIKDHVSPLENKFAAEVVKATAGLKRADMNEIVKQLIPKYSDNLNEAPGGAHFTELVDIKTFKLKPEWVEKYRKIKKELIDLGLPLEE